MGRWSRTYLLVARAGEEQGVFPSFSSSSCPLVGEEEERRRRRLFLPSLLATRGEEQGVFSSLSLVREEERVFPPLLVGRKTQGVLSPLYRSSRGKNLLFLPPTPPSLEVGGAGRKTERVFGGIDDRELGGWVGG